MKVPTDHGSFAGRLGQFQDSQRKEPPRPSRAALDLLQTRLAVAAARLNAAGHQRALEMVIALREEHRHATAQAVGEVAERVEEDHDGCP